MANRVWPSIHANLMRLTKLDKCGVPIAVGPAMLVTDGIVKVSASAEYEDGEDTFKKKGSGKLAFAHKDPDILKYLSLEIEFVGVDPEAWGLITGNTVVTDAAGASTGLRIGNYDVEANFALELWTDVPGVACDGGLTPYGYFLWPFIGQGRVGDLELAVEAAEFTLTANTKPGNGWGAGPYDVVINGTGGTAAAGPLIDPMTGEDHFHMDIVTVAPPALTEGAVVLA